LNASSGLLQDVPFDVVSDISSLVPFSVLRLDNRTLFMFQLDRRPLESISSLISISIGLPSPSTKLVLTFDRPDAMNNISPISCLPRWDAKTIEDARHDVGDVSS
jgi:hypothetical protein